MQVVPKSGRRDLIYSFQFTVDSCRILNVGHIYRVSFEVLTAVTVL
jgi:hypothetical protein